MARRLDGESFAPFIRESTLPVLADFYQDGCVPCRRISPLISKAESEYEGRIAFARVNLAQNAGLAGELDIAAAPTIVLFKDGQETARHRGVIDRSGLKTLIESVL